MIDRLYVSGQRLNPWYDLERCPYCTRMCFLLTQIRYLTHILAKCQLPLLVTIVETLGPKMSNHGARAVPVTTRIIPSHFTCCKLFAPSAEYVTH